MTTTNTQNIGIRVGIVDGDKTRRELILTGEMGERALARIKDAASPAGKSFAMLNSIIEDGIASLENYSGRTGMLGATLTRLGPMGIAAGASISAFTAAVVAGTAEFKEAEQALNHLNSALNATGFASGVTANQISELGEAIESSTLFKKEDIQKAAAALTSFQNITGETFIRALQLSTDLAVRLGTDVPSAAEMLGKALEAPEEGLDRLARKITDLSVAQKEVIKNFRDSGETASAQAVTLDHLESKIKGLSEAQAKGLTGAADALGDAWDDLLESFGRTVHKSGAAEASLNLLAKAIRGVQEAAFPTLEQRKSQLEQAIENYDKRFADQSKRWLFMPMMSDRELAKIALDKTTAELAAEEEKNKKEKEQAFESAKRAIIEEDNKKLRGLNAKSQKEYNDLILTPMQKTLREAEEIRKQINSLNKSPENRAAAEEALAMLDKATKQKLKVLDKPKASPAVRLQENSEDLKQRAIQEINRALLQTKPSYELAKEALDDWKTSLIKNLGGALQANQNYITKIDEIYAVKLKDIYNKSLMDSDKWADGAARALRRYGDEASHAAKNAEEAMSRATEKIEACLSDVITTGDASFKTLRELVLSIEQDFMRSFIRQNITGPLSKGLGDALAKGGSNFLGNIFGQVFHEGGVVGETAAPYRGLPTSAFLGAPRFHNGLMPDEFPAILQKGETVLPKNTPFGDMNITFNITTPNAQSFMESQGQIMNRIATSLQRYRARNG